MSKKYFAKYRPVEGEIKEGDIWMNEDGLISRLIPLPEYKRKRQKVKLFLCSRDIQVGDKVWFFDPNPNVEGFKDWSGWGTIVGIEDGMYGVDLEHTSTWEGIECFAKVIGEISPDALSYVKDGDEFDEEQVSICKGLNYVPVSRRDKDDTIFIKGPCGHFH